MSTCPQCGAALEKDAVVCPNCTALINASSSQTPAPTLPSDRSAELNARLEKAMRRTELLTYAAAGLAVAIFAVIIIISFL